MGPVDPIFVGKKGLDDLICYRWNVTSTGQNLKWDHFGILAKGRSDNHCKIKETLLIQELKPTLNDTVGSEKLYLC